MSKEKMTGRVVKIEYGGYRYKGRYGCKGVLYIWPEDAPGLTQAERQMRKNMGEQCAAEWRERGQPTYFRAFAPVEGKGSAVD